MATPQVRRGKLDVGFRNVFEMVWSAMPSIEKETKLGKSIGAIELKLKGHTNFHDGLMVTVRTSVNWAIGWDSHFGEKNQKLHAGGRKGNSIVRHGFGERLEDEYHMVPDIMSNGNEKSKRVQEKVGFGVSSYLDVKKYPWSAMPSVKKRMGKQSVPLLKRPHG